MMTNIECCPQCGHSVPNGTKFCSECGYTIEQSTSVAITNQNKQQIAIPQQEIKTIQDMENFIEGLSQQANESAEAALKAQLQVIRYVQSPALYDSSFDMLFKNIKNALKYADSPRTEEMIRERATIMIQNYVFFMNAKLQFEIAINQEEQRELMEEGCKMLAESATEVASLAIPGGAVAKASMKAALMTATVKMMTAKDSKGTSFWTRVCRWWTQDSRTKQKEGEFLQTIDKLTAKLYKQRDVIGKSDLIAGIIDRYAIDLTDYFAGDEVTTAESVLHRLYKTAVQNIKKTMWIILSLNLVVLLLRWIFKGLGEAGAYISSKISDSEYVADNSHWALLQWGYALGLFAIIAIITWYVYLTRRNRWQTELRTAKNKYNNLLQNYRNIAAEFEE